MKQRNRSFIRKRLGGSWYYYTTPNDVTTRDVHFSEKIMMDFTEKKKRKDGSLPPSDLELDIIDRDPFGMQRSSGNTFRLSDLAVDDRDRTPNHDGTYKERGTEARILENNYWTQELLARTNPFRPEFSVPIALKELLDVSSMFKLTGATFTSFAGGAYLNYKFGLDTFLKDIKTLTKLHEALSSRVKEFDSLFKHGGLRRRIDLVSIPSETIATNVTINSTLGVTVIATNTSKRTLKFSGSVRWRPVKDWKPELSELDKKLIALQSVLDLGELDGQTAWGLIPFSWLADYFMNWSSFLEGSLNEMLIEPYDICIMRHWDSTLAQVVTSKPATVSIQGIGKYRRQTKARDVWSKGTFPVVRSSLLSSEQFLIMAALIARLRG